MKGGPRGRGSTLPPQKPVGHSPTSETLQPLLLPLLANDEEQSYPQSGQDDWAADGEQLLHIIPLPLSRLDGRDGTCWSEEGESDVPYEQGLGRVPWVRLPLNLSCCPCSHSDLHFLAQSPNPLPLFSPILVTSGQP